MSDDMESIDIKIEAADPDPEGPYSVVSMLPLKKCNGNHAGGLHRKKPRIVSSTEQYEMHLEKVEILKLNVEIEKFEHAVEQGQDKIKELRAAIDTLTLDLEPREQQLEEIRRTNEPLEAKLLALENEWYLLKAKAADSAMDKMNAFKTEIDLSKLKQPILENMIQILSLEESIAPLKKHEDEAKRSLSIELDAIAKKESELLALKATLEKANATWAAKWEDVCDGESPQQPEDKVVENSKAVSSTTGHVVDEKADDEIIGLKAEPRQAHEEISKKSKEIEALKAAKTMLCVDNENASISGKSDTAQSTKNKSEASDMEKEIKDLKDQIEQMKPLYWIGYWTRGRKIDLDLRNSGSKHWSKANIDKGNDAFKDHDVLADATLYMEFSPQKRLHPGEFVNTYGISPTIVWSNRNFKSYINILNWKADMLHRFPHTYDTKKFSDNLPKILPKMYPSFHIRNDEDVQNNEEHRQVYEILKTERANAVVADFKAGGPNRPRPQWMGCSNGNSANNNTRFAAPKKGDSADSGSTA